MIEFHLGGIGEPAINSFTPFGASIRSFLASWRIATSITEGRLSHIAFANCSMSDKASSESR